MKSFALILSLFLIQPALAERAADSASLAQIRKFQESRDAYAKKIADFDKEITALEKSIAQCKQCPQEAIVEMQRVINVKNNEVEALRKGLVYADSQIANFQRSLDSRNEVEKIAMTTDALTLRMDVSGQRIQVAEQQNRITKAEADVDRMGTGIYVQNKILALLNSQVICSAAARCATKEKVVIDKNRLKEIFPAMDPDNVLDGDYYHTRGLQQKNSSQKPSGTAQ